MLQVIKRLYLVRNFSDRLKDCDHDLTMESTRDNSADSVPTSNFVSIKELAIRTTFCIAGIIYYTCNLDIDIQCTRYKNGFNKCF